MKREEIFEASQGFNTLGQVEGNRKFYYAVAKNVTTFESKVKEMTVKRNEHLKGYDEFEKERLEKIQDFIKKDKDGKVEVIGGQTSFDESKREDWDKELKKLNKKHNGAWDLEQDRVKEFNDVYMKEEVEIEIHKIKEEDSPEKMKPNQAKYLLLMI